MNFRFADCHTLLLACVLFGFLPMAKAQSPGAGQRIVFSSPDGQITSNAPIPMVQAPEGRQAPDLPSGQVTVHDFAEPVVAPLYPQPLPLLPRPDDQNQDDFRGSMDVRKEMGALTPGQIMNVPTEEQIFGLPEKSLNNQKEPWQLDNENPATNDLAFGTNSLFAEPSWAKLWTENAPKSPESSNTTERASGFFSKFFDSAQNDDGFGNHNANNGDETVFGSGQPAAQQQSSWDSGLASGGLTPPPSAAAASASDFTSPSGSSSGLTAQSPFTPPQVTTLDTMPKLPSLPSLPGQKGQLTQPASTPSWAPQPPPWTQPQTPFGTPVQQFNQALKR